jgi:outer membrane protein assembly factor BamA
MAILVVAILAVLSISSTGQIATGIHLVDVRFSGDTQLDGVDLKKCATDLKSQLYEGTQWADGLVDTVQTQCLLDKGYFKAAVKASTQQLPDKKNTHQFVITFDIDAGPRYRLGNITFKNNHAISDAKALRDLFPIKDGDIFDRNLVAKGLDNLGEAYSELGYINFTSVPDAKFDDEKKLIFLDIDGDEGKQFYVRRIEFQGNTTTPDDVIRRELAIAEGQIYNSRLWKFSLLHLNQLGYFEPLKPDDPNTTDRKLDEKNGTVDLTLKVKENECWRAFLVVGVISRLHSESPIEYQSVSPT